MVVTGDLLALCDRHGRSPDKGKAFFRELAAKQIAVYRGLGFRGAYLGGVHDFEACDQILAMERTFAPGDWKQFARELLFSRAGEYYYYGRNEATGLADPKTRGVSTDRRSKHVGPAYALSKWAHHMMFTPGNALNDLGARACANAEDPFQGPKPLRVAEHLSKAVLFGCKDCGDCSLPEIAFLCPESQCAKNQRNGPCGGTREGRCEVDGFGDCIWLRAYERLKHDGRGSELLAHAPVVQNQGLRGTSSWANYWLGRDHLAQRAAATALPADAPSKP